MKKKRNDKNLHFLTRLLKLLTAKLNSCEVRTSTVTVEQVLLCDNYTAHEHYFVTFKVIGYYPLCLQFYIVPYSLANDSDGFVPHASLNSIDRLCHLGDTSKPGPWTEILMTLPAVECLAIGDPHCSQLVAS